MGEFIEIPFGAFDSESKGFEYTIPEGMEAVIEDGKVIIRLKESEDKRMARAINNMLPFIPDRAYNNNGVTKKDILDWLEKQKYYWKPTEEDVTLFNKAIITNTSLTPQERAKLDIIRMKFKHHPNIEQKEQKPSIFPPGLGEVHFNPISSEQKPADWTGYSGIIIDKTEYSELTDAEWAILRGFVRVTGLSHFPITIIKETAQDFLAHLVMISEICNENK